ncbi:PAP2 superfamily [Streptoalloteichus tenebrarius]|uniref:PAP2 superfamily n=1 Tax=Streptoalloteichus tenebrarius (strain ATCC 17920 / DSM 40477 / JCM 4838 / CBS 697.72 / NBRC 16177 / NCIMB 11028 / NRRL B-12390 / A12253. 1 / ISP 5477) TaxID=1933 RepID=A0ABT1HXF0_STRSD|nr:hypothetical protein [Streptoalloteichus tenebrarius]MCP2260194.1 PAP2 superfamily [Streptoalloteichus tenebrarius]
MTATGTTEPRRLLAAVASNVFGPEVWVVTLPLAVGWRATGERIWPTLGWSLWIAVFAAVIPMVVMVRGARRGQWEGRYVDNREARLVPFLVCMGSVLLGSVGLWLGRAPGALIALAAAMLATLAVCLYITVARRWKISLHSAVATGAVAILTVLYGPWAALVAPLAALSAWSRVVLGKHTVAQVFAGAAVAVLAGGGLFWSVQAVLP